MENFKNYSISNDINNYRPISFISNLYIIFGSILNKRILNYLQMSLTKEQAGFRKGFSTSAHLQTINQIIEKSREYNSLCI